MILDCCHSGKALAAGALASGDDSEVYKNLAVIDGSFVLTATSRKYAFASATGVTGHKAFTGTLLDVLNTGAPSDEQFLSMDTVFRLVRKKLRAANRPAPQASGRHTASTLALTLNRQWLWATGHQTTETVGGAGRALIATVSAAPSIRNHRCGALAGAVMTCQRLPMIR